MTRKQRRATIVVSGVTVLVVASLLVLSAMRDSIVYFHSPTEVAALAVPTGQTIRIGGLVEMESIRLGQGETVFFSVTDLEATIPVEFTGILPDLFREGQGVVVEGAMTEQGAFAAKSVLAKHDEQYMPPEAADALKDAGHWDEYQEGLKAK